jgi:membrane protease YdiL (CAAX protease family)
MTNPPSSRQSSVWIDAATPIVVTLGVIWIAVVRDRLAQTFPTDAGPITITGYGTLLALTALIAHTTRWQAFGHMNWGLALPIHIAAGVVAGVVIAAPALRVGALPAAGLLHLPASLAVASIEEATFRGALFALWEQRFGKGAAVVVTSVAFALAHAAHYPPVVLILGLLLGVAFATWRALRNDLVAPIVAHTIADTLGLAALG